MNTYQKKVAINKVLSKDGTTFDEVLEAHQTCFTYLADYSKKHEGEEKDKNYPYDMEWKHALAHTAEDHHNKGTMKWLVEFLVGSADIAKGERDKWLDFVEVFFMGDNVKVSKALVDWDIKYHREAFDQIYNTIFNR